ncbi:MAG: hypothetical protein DWQ05_12675 [Calditrichaeota bacterium]|nr:MAG: hypothetical protein DWQ05_12675 [Calditrichota bacterium]
MQTNIIYSKRWLAVAIGALMTGGLLSLILVIGRVPFINTLITDPNFAKKCLIVHVNLSIFVWFSAYIAGLFQLIPESKFHIFSRSSVLWAAIIGLVLLVITLVIPDVEPILSNYIPVLNHPFFFAGLGLFALSVCVAFLDARLFSSFTSTLENAHNAIPSAAVNGIKAAVVAFLLAVITFGISWFFIDKSVAPDLFFELLFWGGGHVLQFANVLAMLVAWIFLVKKLTGSEFISKKISTVLYIVFVLPLFIAPYFASQIQSPGIYLSKFTTLMQHGIFPIVCLFIILAIKKIFESKATGKMDSGQIRSSAFNGFAASVILILTGFIFGALIRGSDTMIPAHYHAAIGAVTVSFMAMTYELFPRFSLEIPSEKLQKLANWQPAIYGIGQFLFAAGLAYARMLRKVYGEEQIVNSVSQKVGLGIMGFGGLLAVTGGVLFIWIALRTWWNRSPQAKLVTNEF